MQERCGELSSGACPPRQPNSTRARAPSFSRTRGPVSPGAPREDPEARCSAAYRPRPMPFPVPRFRNATLVRWLYEDNARQSCRSVNGSSAEPCPKARLPPSRVTPRSNERARGARCRPRRGCLQDRAICWSYSRRRVMILAYEPCKLPVAPPSHYAVVDCYSFAILVRSRPRDKGSR